MLYPDGVSGGGGRRGGPDRHSCMNATVWVRTHQNCGSLVQGVYIHAEIPLSPTEAQSEWTWNTSHGAEPFSGGPTRDGYIWRLVLNKYLVRGEFVEGYPNVGARALRVPKMVPKTARASPLWSQNGARALRGPKMVPKIAKASPLWSQNGARVRGQCAEGCPNVAASALRGPKMVPESAKARARARDVD